VMTGGLQHEWLYYTADPVALANAFNRLAAESPDWPVRLLTDFDPDWEAYLLLRRREFALRGGPPAPSGGGEAAAPRLEGLRHRITRRDAPPQQQREKDPRLESVEPAGANDPPAQQVDLAAGEAVGPFERLARPGARGQQHRYPARRFAEDVGELRSHVAAAGRGDHEAVDPVREQRADMPAVVAERDRHEPDARISRCSGRERRDPGHTRIEAHAALGDPTDRPRHGRAERGRAARVKLAHEARRVHLVVENDEATHAAGLFAGRDLDRREQVGRPVGPGKRRIAHGAAHDDRHVEIEQAVEHEGALLDRVGALR